LERMWKKMVLSRSPGSYLEVFLEKLGQNSHLFIFL